MELDKILKLYHNSMDETNIFVMCMIELYFLKIGDPNALMKDYGIC